jgi:hypothetical protein
MDRWPRDRIDAMHDALSFVQRLVLDMSSRPASQLDCARCIFLASLCKTLKAISISVDTDRVHKVDIAFLLADIAKAVETVSEVDVDLTDGPGGTMSDGQAVISWLQTWKAPITCFTLQYDNAALDAASMSISLEALASRAQLQYLMLDALYVTILPPSSSAPVIFPSLRTLHLVSDDLASILRPLTQACAQTLSCIQISGYYDLDSPGIHSGPPLDLPYLRHVAIDLSVGADFLPDLLRILATTPIVSLTIWASRPDGEFDLDWALFEGVEGRHDDWARLEEVLVDPAHFPRLERLAMVAGIDHHKRDMSPCDPERSCAEMARARARFEKLKTAMAKRGVSVNFEGPYWCEMYDYHV